MWNKMISTKNELCAFLELQITWSSKDFQKETEPEVQLCIVCSRESKWCRFSTRSKASSRSQAQWWWQIGQGIRREKNLKKKKEIGRERVGFCFSVKTENPSESALDFIFDFSLFSFLFNSSLIWFDLMQAPEHERATAWCLSASNWKSYVIYTLVPMCLVIFHLDFHVLKFLILTL